MLVGEAENAYLWEQNELSSCFRTYFWKDTVTPQAASAASSGALGVLRFLSVTDQAPTECGNHLLAGLWGTWGQEPCSSLVLGPSISAWGEMKRRMGEWRSSHGLRVSSVLGSLLVFSGGETTASPHPQRFPSLLREISTNQRVV